MPLRLLFAGLEPVVDVVAIHGLNPLNHQDHELRTWEKNGNLWLRDNFKYVFPKARTLLYVYNSSPAFGSNKERFIYEANELLERLRIGRRKDSRRPLILIAHSLGGILIKQALVNAQANQRYKEILDSTFGLMFFGTPHAGPTDDAKVKFGKICARVANKVVGDPKNDLMQALEKNLLFSDLLQENWRHHLESYKIVSFYEGIGDLVPRDSAVLGLSGARETAIRINADHRSMCRFDLSIQTDEDNYQLVEANLEELCSEALKQVEVTEPRIAGNDILRSLERASWNPRLRELPSAHHESFRWLWERDVTGPGFVNWLENGSGIFWISGKPGSGKSTLMKHIVDDSRTLLFLRPPPDPSKRHDLLLKVCYAFYDQSSVGEKSFLGMISGILYQILRAQEAADLLPAVLPIWKRAAEMVLKGPGNIKLTTKEIEEAIFAIRNQQSVQGNICLFIDGLDECVGDWHQELSFLTKLVAPSTGQKLFFKACVLSRPENIIRDYLGGNPGFRIHDRTFDDVLLYVQSQLGDKVLNMSYLKEGNRYSGNDLIQDIVKKASGVFIWVRLAVLDLVEGFTQGDDLEELERRLSDLPPDLSTFYSRILERINDRYVSESVTYFALVVASETPTFEFGLSLMRFGLAVKPWREAITCSADVMSPDDSEGLTQRIERRIQSRCRNLLEVTASVGPAEPEILHVKPDPFRNLSRVTFLHKTAKEFLTTEETITSLLKRAKQTPENEWIQLMALALRLLKVDPSSQPLQDEVVEEFTRGEEVFHQFKVLPWVGVVAQFFYFARRSELSTGSAQIMLMEAMDLFLRSKNKNWCSKWWANYRRTEPSTQFTVTFVNLAVKFGCVLYVEDCLKRTRRSSQKLKRIITRDVNTRPLLFYTLDIGMPADEWLPEDMIELLLEDGEDINECFQGISFCQQIMQGTIDFLVPMHAERILSLLLEYGADVSCLVDMAGYQCTPLHQYIHSLKNVTPIEPIFSRFCRDTHSETADFSQWRRGASPARVSHALEWPRNHFSTSPEVDDSLALLYYEHISNMMKLFIEKGADIHIQDSNGESVLDLCDGMPTVYDFLLNHQREQGRPNCSVDDEKELKSQCMVC